MRTFLIVSLLAIAGTAGCSTAKDAPADELAIPEVTVDQLATMLASGACQPVDANGERTRHKLGVIPGALLLSDSETFLPSELPADKAKPLVFYCANKFCGASHEAAAKARTAGYRHVKVLPAGIAGWRKAGQQTQAI